MRNYAGGARLAPVVGLIAAVGVVADANASGFQLKEQSAEGLGNAFAGSSAKAQDLSTIFFNPAGMTSLSGHQAQQVLSYIAPTAEFQGSGSTNTTFGGPVSGTGYQDDAAENALVPSLYLMYDYSDDLKFGLAVNTPFGLVTDYDSDWTGRYHALRSDLMTIAVQPTIAYEVNDWLSIGGGPIFQYANAELTKAVDARSAVFGGLVAGGAPLATAAALTAGIGDARSKVTGDDVSAGYSVGVMFEPVETTRIGLSYRSRIIHELDGDVEFENLPTALRTNPAFRNGKGRAELNLPDSASLGIYHEFSPQFAVMGEVSWTNWSLFRELSVYREGDPGALSTTVEDWNDTWFYSLGATYSPIDKLKLQIGVAYDQSPVPDATRTPRVPDADRTWLALGVGYEFMPGMTANLAYTHIWVDDASINLGNEGGGLPEHAVSGTYKSDIDIIAAQLKVTF
ncbi:OmpP1/FadL family transporter [Caenispirillum bisanense]|uniref:Long-chain fatty acid transport protein n=1 Tax=Caenispirillum bisanense TaxID=414052 RepID=A0A286H1U7_9PROT|nr:outer membrane protein transport protein [Caenispirillum bisanense]SOE01284.1 long-chain fatty acid transport protein [Caenispirillum bisanense]